MVHIWKKNKELWLELMEHLSLHQDLGSALCKHHPIHRWEQPGVTAKREGPRSRPPRPHSWEGNPGSGCSSGSDVRTEPADLLYLQHDMNNTDQKPEKTITDIQEMLISWLISPDSECITFVQSLKWTQSNNKEHLEAMKKKEGDN